MKKNYFSFLMVITSLLLLGSCKQEVFVEGGKSAGTVTDIDGNTYDCIKIGDQTWTTQNLKVKHFNNGDAIDTTMIYTKRELNVLRNIFELNNYFQDSIPSCKYYLGSMTKYGMYGRYYNTKVITDSRNIAPEGWHIATDEDWTKLEKYLIANGCNWDQSTSDNKLAKSLASISIQNGMIVKDTLANNKSGLNLLPGGKTSGSGILYDLGMIWTNKGICGYYWSPSKDRKLIAYRYLKNSIESSARIIDFDNSVAYQIRCVKDK
jgi:uncharacterized protein (TIGR02145 family)